ncbi:hypothetical protein GON01_11685, partial [Sphingomonas sp. MAH-20]|nr:M10 family metallopeptidase C-terminal domain-containing protein [Sphingomonas sp. CGMCC 1.13658]MVO78588.1 hypothetical protein [Sphingomonas horti]
NGGADTLMGGLGRDKLTGGEGNDVFVFNTRIGQGDVDQLTDFISGTDKIHLENAIFTQLAVGSLSADAFTIGTAAADSSDRIIFDQATGSLFYDADGRGGASATLFATLQPHAALSSTDFFVI